MHLQRITQLQTAISDQMGVPMPPSSPRVEPFGSAVSNHVSGKHWALTPGKQQSTTITTSLSCDRIGNCKKLIRQLAD